MPLTLTLSPHAGRGDFVSAADPFSPLAGRRSRQGDEGLAPGTGSRMSGPPSHGSLEWNQ
ncbi:hypothetical protein CN137_08490 [Sinorhizobium meliloti]|nr:hypothetical protein CN137_08490 [Sinorhizobium meliloti]